MWEWLRQRKARKAYWDRPPQGSFRIRFEGCHWYVERFNPKTHRWDYVTLDSDKDVARSKVKDFLAKEAMAPEYFDPVQPCATE